MRPIARIIGILMSLALAGSALLPWWNLMGMTEPHFVLLVRAVVLALAVASILFFVLGRGGRVVGWAATAALCMPFLMLLTMAVYDPSDAALAASQNNQAGRLISALSRIDVEPAVPWTEARGFTSASVIRNDYGLVDAVETLSFYSREGMYLCGFTGLILLILVWRIRQGQGAPIRFRPLLLSAVFVAMAAIYLVPSVIANLYWQMSRAAESSGNGSKALSLLESAAHWDPRLNYDIAFHFDLGRLYGQLGMIDQPDYWATVADIYESSANLNNDQVQGGYYYYKTKIQDTHTDPTIPVRMANAFLREGSLQFAYRRDLMALNIWREALTLDPTNIETQWAIATVETRRRDYLGAIRDWKKIIAENEGVGLFRNRLFVSMTFRKMLTARAWSSLAWCFYQTGRYDDALVAKRNERESGSEYETLGIN